jgi:hypothetical protein
MCDLRSGYAYKYKGTRNWKASSDEKWEIVVIDAQTAKRVGARRIDGTYCAVFHTTEGFYAQRNHT